MLDMTTTHDPVSPFDPDDFPLVDPFPPFSWVAPTDDVIAAMLADPDSNGPDVLADDCGHVAAFGTVHPMPCGVYLCPPCASAHDASGCLPCDADARACADPDD
jgi:hypothetical protein